MMESSGKLQTSRRSSNFEGSAHEEELLKSGRLQARRRSSNIEGGTHEELIKSERLERRRSSSNPQEEVTLQMRRRSSNVEVPPWGEILVYRTGNLK